MRGNHSLQDVRIQEALVLCGFGYRRVMNQDNAKEIFGTEFD